RILRHVAGRRDEARVKGAEGRARVLAGLTWDHAAAAAERRLLALRDRPVRRPGAAPGPAKVGPAPAATGRKRRTLCMIVKDEERNLADCLRGFAPLFDQVVVIDTGSTDRTREIAKGFGAEVYDFPWCDSFSAARNESLRHATGDWVMWADADDRIDDAN